MSEAKSGNTTIYRWGGVTKEKRRGLLRHSMRDLDKRAGREMSHSNTMIDPARTLDNVTMINDGHGGFVRAQSIDQVIELADAMVDAAPSNVRRMADDRVVPVALRSDAAVMIEYILELDPEWTGPWATATPEKRAEVLRLLNVMIEEVIEHDGAENVVAWSFNLDETNAHVHMYTIPVDEAGRVNMKSKFDGHSKGGAKRAYIERHDAMRTRLNEHGYEATFARIEGSPKHEALAKYKARKEREKQVAEFSEKVMDGDRVNKANAAKIAAAREQLDADLADLEEAEDDLDERASDIAARETDWLTRKRRLDAREADLDRRDQETADARLAAQRAQRDRVAQHCEAGRDRPCARSGRQDRAHRARHRPLARQPEGGRWSHHARSVRPGHEEDPRSPRRGAGAHRRRRPGAHSRPQPGARRVSARLFPAMSVLPEMIETWQKRRSSIPRRWSKRGSTRPWTRSSRSPWRTSLACAESTRTSHPRNWSPT